MTTQIRLSRPSRFSAFKAIILCLLAGLSLPTMLYADWDGGVKKPSTIEKNGRTFYEIESAENLAWFMMQVNKGNTGYNAVLKKDISIVDSAVTGKSVKWTPIGDADSVSYKGVFDGDGHTISGVYSNARYAGFFGFIGPGAVIKNLNLQNVLVQSYFEGTSRAGLLSSMFSGDSVINVSVAGTVSDTTYAGGLAAIIKSKAYINGFRGDVYFVGKAKKYNEYIVYSEKQVAGGVAALVMDSVKILNSHVSGFADSSEIRGMVGGFIGIDSAYAYFENDTNNVNIRLNDSPSYLGGFVMRVAPGAAADFVSCLNRGNIQGSQSYVGGFVGYSKGNLSFYNSVNEGEIKHPGSITSSQFAGGFIGCMSANGQVSIDHSFNMGNVYSAYEAGGFVGFAITRLTITDSENAGTIDGKTAAGGFVGHASADSSLIIDYSRNVGTIVGRYTGGFIGEAWDTIIIDHSVNAGEIAGTGEHIAGFIAQVSGKTAKVDVRNSTNMGKIITDGGADVGGIFGTCSNCTATNCENYGEIILDGKDNSKTANVGGILGNWGSAINCRNYGNITIDSVVSPTVGGIAGLGTVQGCVNKGAITVNTRSTSKVGGIGGQTSAYYSLNEGRVVVNLAGIGEECYAAGITATISSTTRLGGNVNKGTIIVNGGNGDAHVYPLHGVSADGKSTRAKAVAGSISLSDSIVNNGRLTAGSTLKNNKDTVAQCAFFDKDIYRVDDDSLGFGISTAEMETIEFAYRLNTCNGLVKNSGYWSQHGDNYPVMSDQDNHAIYKVIFKDSSRVINIKTYKIGESLTNYKGVIIDMPEAPDPSDADEDLKFGYWAYENQVIDENTIINGDYTVYATYVPKNSVVETLAFKTETGDVFAKYVISDKMVEITLPNAPSKNGYEFLGWYNGNQFVGAAGAKIVPNGLSVLNAKYETILYKISFISRTDTLQTGSFAYGDMPEYKGEKPTCAELGYEFDGWMPIVAAVSADKSYYARCSKNGAGISSSSSEQPSSSSEIASNSSSSLGDEESSSSMIASSSSDAESSSSAKPESSSSSKANSSSSKGTDIAWNAVRPMFNLTVNGMTLTLSNTQGGVVRIFDALGHMVAAKSIASATTSITLQTPGNYIVRVNGMSRSVILK